jgi:hypothetical protein
MYGADLFFELMTRNHVDGAWHCNNAHRSRPAPAVHVLPNDQQLATEAMVRVLGCWETGGKQEDQREVILIN